MGETILALNAGSATLKCGLFEVAGDGVIRAGSHMLTHQGAESMQGVVLALLDWARELRPGAHLAAIGHRVVHGGQTFAGPARITPESLRQIEALSPLAPLHQPQSAAAIHAVSAARPDLDQVACFDTAFHATQPEVATRLAIPRALHDQGVRRYGFHGLSYEYIAGRLAELDPALLAGRLIVAHLGSGASLCALKGGVSIDTTMGFSPLDGLVMSTRPGTLDAGVVLYLLQHQGMDAGQIEHLLYQESGLLGVSGLTGDMKALLASDAAAAREAVELFVYRAGREAAALAGVMGGLDGVVFTGGIGEHSAEIRGRIGQRLAWLGVDIDPAANAAGAGPIGVAAAPVRAWVIPTDEEAVIARQTRALLV